jgi:ABC-type hemin transport system substrate-binding protein
MSDIKSAYELAQERLAKKSPAVYKLTDAKKQELSEIDKVYAAKIAQSEMALQEQIRAVAFAGEDEKAEKLRDHLTAEIQKLRAEKETKKQAIREAKK